MQLRPGTARGSRAVCGARQGKAVNWKVALGEAQKRLEDMLEPKLEAMGVVELDVWRGSRGLGLC